MKSNQLIEHELRQRFRLDYRLEMREVSFVGECSIDLSKLDQPLNGKCAYLGQNLFNDKTNDEDVEWNGNSSTEKQFLYSFNS